MLRCPITAGEDSGSASNRIFRPCCCTVEASRDISFIFMHVNIATSHQLDYRRATDFSPSHVTQGVMCTVSLSGMKF